MVLAKVKMTDSMIKDPAEDSEHFSSHFCSVDAYVNSKIQRSNGSPLSYMGQSSITSFYAGPASDIEVELIILGLNCRSCFPKSVLSLIIEKVCKID